MSSCKLITLSLATAMLAAASAESDAADAARVPAYSAPPPIPLVYNWTGFYGGGHLGAGWSEGGSSGFLGGGQVGFNYQINQWVWGVEGQISAITNQNNDDLCGAVTFTPLVGAVVNDRLFRCDNRGRWVASIAARLGVTFGPTGNWLLYVKGGGAFADSRFGVRLRDDCLGVFGAAVCNSNFDFNNDNG